MSFVDKTQLEPGSTVLLHNKVRSAAQACGRRVGWEQAGRQAGPLRAWQRAEGQPEPARRTSWGGSLLGGRCATTGTQALDLAPVGG